MTWALECRSVRAQLGGQVVLHDVSLSIASGRWVSLVGPNGAGKSTLLRVLAGLQPCEGDLLLKGQAMATWKPRARAQYLAWLGQGQHAAHDLTVYDVAMLGRLPHRSWLGSPSAADHQAVEAALRSTQTWSWRGRALGQLSAGEVQRVLLARVLAVQAQVLLMDEPLTNLDPPHQVDWLQRTRALVAGGQTVVSVLHEISLALQADELMVMNAGRIVHHGECDDPATHQALEQVFEGRIQVQQVAGQWVCLPRL